MQKFIKIGNKRISTPIIDILKKIKDNIFNGKLQTIRMMGDNIRVSCPFHKNGLEKRASSDIYIGDSSELEYGYFKCFTCGEQAPFYHFVAECFDKSDDWAKQWLIENFADDTTEDIPDVMLPKIILSKKTTSYLDETVLSTFEAYHPYMTKRKLTKNIISQFEVKYDDKSKCIVFPVRDAKGKLVMLTRRSVIDKNFIIDKDKEKPIYLLYYLLQHNIEQAIVVESQINALTAFGYGYPAIATFGCNVTEKQFELLNKSCIKHYYLAFDGDEAGKKGTKKFLENIRKDVFVDVMLIPPGKDVNDLSEEEFINLKIMDGQEWLKLYC